LVRWSGLRLTSSAGWPGVAAKTHCNSCLCRANWWSMAASGVSYSSSQPATKVSSGRMVSSRGEPHSVSTSAYNPPWRRTTMYLQTLDFDVATDCQTRTTMITKVQTGSDQSSSKMCRRMASTYNGDALMLQVQPGQDSLPPSMWVGKLGCKDSYQTLPKKRKRRRPAK